MRRTFLLFALCGLVTPIFGAPVKDAMGGVDERYAHLVLALGQHDPDYVDAFYGPAEWKTQAEKENRKNRVKSKYLTFRLALQTT